MDPNPDNLAAAKRRLPSTRFGRPSDLAGVVTFPLFDDTAWTNDQIWSVDGGAMLRE